MAIINKVKRINIIKDIYPIPISVFQFSPLFKEKYEFLSGAFYGLEGYPQVALYYSDENGKILSDIPVILEEGVLTFEDLFRYNEYVLID